MLPTAESSRPLRCAAAAVALAACFASVTAFAAPPALQKKERELNKKLEASYGPVVEFVQSLASDLDAGGPDAISPEQAHEFATRFAKAAPDLAALRSFYVKNAAVFAKDGDAAASAERVLGSLLDAKQKLDAAVKKHEEAKGAAMAMELVLVEQWKLDGRQPFPLRLDRLRAEMARKKKALDLQVGTLAKVAQPTDEQLRAFAAAFTEFADSVDGLGKFLAEYRGVDTSKDVDLQAIRRERELIASKGEREGAATVLAELLAARVPPSGPSAEDELKRVLMFEQAMFADRDRYSADLAELGYQPRACSDGTRGDSKELGDGWGAGCEWAIQVALHANGFRARAAGIAAATKGKRFWIDQSGEIKPGDPSP